MWQRSPWLLRNQSHTWNDIHCLIVSCIPQYSLHTITATTRETEKIWVKLANTKLVYWYRTSPLMLVFSSGWLYSSNSLQESCTRWSGWQRTEAIAMSWTVGGRDLGGGGGGGAHVHTSDLIFTEKRGGRGNNFTTIDCMYAVHTWNDNISFINQDTMHGPSYVSVQNYYIYTPERTTPPLIRTL